MRGKFAFASSYHFMGLLASMRPAQIAREIAPPAPFRPPDGGRFNEARANCAGNCGGAGRRRVGRGAASMRPAQIAREILGGVLHLQRALPASMRPAQIAREIFGTISQETRHQQASMRPAQIAREIRRGRGRHLWRKVASMRPAQIAREIGG